MKVAEFKVQAMYHHNPNLGKSGQNSVDSSFNYVCFLLFLKHQENHTPWEFWGNCQLVFPSKRALLSKIATEVWLLFFCT